MPFNESGTADYFVSFDEIVRFFTQRTRSLFKENLRGVQSYKKAYEGGYDGTHFLY